MSAFGQERTSIARARAFHIAKYRRETMSSVRPGWIRDARFTSSSLTPLLQDDCRLAISVSGVAPCWNSASAPAMSHSYLSA